MAQRLEVRVVIRSAPCPRHDVMHFVSSPTLTVALAALAQVTVAPEHGEPQLRPTGRHSLAIAGFACSRARCQCLSIGAALGAGGRFGIGIMFSFPGQMRARAPPITPTPNWHIRRRGLRRAASHMAHYELAYSAQPSGVTSRIAAAWRLLRRILLSTTCRIWRRPSRWRAKRLVSVPARRLAARRETRGVASRRGMQCAAPASRRGRERQQQPTRSSRARCRTARRVRGCCRRCRPALHRR